MAEYDIKGVAHSINSKLQPSSAAVKIPHVNGSEEIALSAQAQEEKAVEFNERTINSKGVFSVKA